MKVAVCRPLTPCHLGKRQAASPPRTPNRRDYLTLPSAVESLWADQPNQRDARGPIGQLRVKARPAVTSQSRPLRVAPFPQAVRGPASPRAYPATTSHQIPLHHRR
jgi:hypothetical protein